MAAECSLVRCSQEKRFFRKELQRWSRNILLVVGFERIAEELMGNQRWKNFSFPFDDTDLEPTDWVQDNVCYFCQSKKSPPFDPASGIIPISNEYCSLHNENGGEDSLEQTTLAGSSDPSKDQPLDLSVHSTRKSDQQPPNFKSTFNGNHNGGGPSDDGEGSDSGISGSNNFIKVPHVPVKSGSKRRFDPNGKKSYTEDELKAALRDIQSGKLGTRRAAVIYGIPRSTLRNKVYKMALDKKEQLQRHQHPKLKKNSDEMAVETAPIPVVKDKEEDCKGISASESLRRLLKQTITSKQRKEITGTKSSVLENNIPNSLGGEEEEEEANESGDTVTPWSQLKGDSNNTTDALNSSLTIDYNQSISPLLTQVLANIQHLALANGAADVNDLRDLVAKEVRDTCSSFPLLPELIRRLAEERFELERGKMIKQRLENDFMDNNPIDDLLENRNEISNNICSSGSSALSNVILKIPSYIPTKVCSVGSAAKVNDSVSTTTTSTKTNATLPPHHSTRPSTASAECATLTSSQNSSGNNKGITVSLKELIARSINQRLGNSINSVETGAPLTEIPSQGEKATSDKCLSSVTNSVINEEGAEFPTEDGDALTKKHVETIADSSSPSSMAPTTASLSDCGSNQQHHKSEKRRRPKRGRYRNYDTDNLAQAVRAVQKGEMSVHRAGTYFGVPHSTLEYKVKERHLLRPKKRKNSASKSFKNNHQRGAVYQKPYYLRASGKSGLMTERDGPSLSGLSPNGLSSSQAEDDELEDDENREKDHFNMEAIVNGSSRNSASQLNLYNNTGASSILPNPLTLWQNMPFFPVDLGLAQVATNGFFASQMMKKLQENVRLQEENALKKNNNLTTNSYNFSESEKRRIPETSLGLGLGSNVGILETLIKSTLEKSIPKLKESAGVNNVNLELPTLTNTPLTTCKESLRKKV